MNILKSDVWCDNSVNIRQRKKRLSHKGSIIQVNENQLDKTVSPAVRQFQPQDIKNTLLAELSWTHHLTIFSRCKTEEEREFYLRMAIKEKYTKRELNRQISASLFERVMIGNAKLSTLPRELNTDIANPFKDNYVLEFLNLSEPHSESELQMGLIKQMKNFILELGRDFIFIDQEYKVQVESVT